MFVFVLFVACGALLHLLVPELALTALWDVQGDDVVTALHRGDAFTNTLHDASALMAKDAGEQALRIHTTQRVGICNVWDFITQFAY